MIDREGLEKLREKIAVLVQIAIVGYKIDGKQSDHAELFADRIWSLITREENRALLAAGTEGPGMREAFDKYADHLEWCRTQHPEHYPLCDCGYDEMVAALAAAQEERPDVDLEEKIGKWLYDWCDEEVTLDASLQGAKYLIHDFNLASRPVEAKAEAGKPWDDPCPECGGSANRHLFGCWRGLKNPAPAASTGVSRNCNCSLPAPRCEKCGCMVAANTEGLRIVECLQAFISECTANGYDHPTPEFKPLVDNARVALRAFDAALRGEGGKP